MALFEARARRHAPYVNYFRLKREGVVLALCVCDGLYFAALWEKMRLSSSPVDGPVFPLSCFRTPYEKMQSSMLIVADLSTVKLSDCWCKGYEKSLF